MARWSRFLLYALTLPFTNAQAPGQIAEVGNTLVSTMMMFLGNDQKVYMLDKVEGNPTQINGHPAWAVEWDIATSKATPMDMFTNVFCASGMHLPNGTFATFGGNGAIGPGGNVGSVQGPGFGLFDATYQDYDGGTAIRLLDPCTTTGACRWFDNASQIAMQKRRWYSTAEPIDDGSMVIIGGFVNGGYINRNFPNNDPAFSGGAAEPTYEFYPPNGRQPQMMQFMVKTSGLNSYAHAFHLPSGRMFVQANYSTIIWDYSKNVETPLPDLPGQVVRVYPASGAVAMLPLTPANNWTPTILFCGGINLPDEAWGNYANPAINTWEHPASNDCQRITPEPLDGSPAVYEQDDGMIEGRTMGQFIALPDGTMLVINGALNGTAGYAEKTGQTPSLDQMPFGMSLASGPVLTPAIYNPNAPKGSRWSRDGLQASEIPRLYHSSALLLPDASVLVAGSNPNIDYNITRPFKTEYRAEKFYPPYWSATRPDPQGIPDTLGYGGPSFDIKVSPAGYKGDANAAAEKSNVVLIRPGFTTHAMNMGQRMLQLNNTFTVSDDGTITLHVSQVPPNPKLLTPGPVLLFVVVNGIPSIGKHIIVGNGQIGPQTVNSVAPLPDSVRSTSSGASGSGVTKSSSKTFSTGVIVALATGGIVAVIAAGVGFLLYRRRGVQPTKANQFYARDSHGGGSSNVFMPLHQVGSSTWNVNYYPEQSDHGLSRMETPTGGKEMRPSYSNDGFHGYHR
jgi:hypothetical protein